MIDRQQNTFLNNLSQDQNPKQTHEEYLLNILDNLQPTHTMSRSQLYRVQLTMGIPCTLICGGVCRLYISYAKDNKWKNLNIEGGLVVCIDKEMNYAPFLRIFDLNTFKIRFEMEMFREFDKYVQLANPQFMVIKIPNVEKSYFGISFGEVEDGRMIHGVITYITQIDNLPELFSLPNIQELLVRRNIALQRKDNHEKYGKSQASEVNVQFTTEKKQKTSLLNDRKQDFQKTYQSPLKQEYSRFWGDKEKESQERDFLGGGRVSNTSHQFNENQIEHKPNNTKRGDLFHGDPNLILLNDKSNQRSSQQSSNFQQGLKSIYNNNSGENSQYDDSSTDQKQSKVNTKNEYLKTNTFGNATQSVALNNISQIASPNQQKQTNAHGNDQQQTQMNNTQVVQPNIFQGLPMNRSLIVGTSQPLSISSRGYDESSKIYDIKKIDPSLREIVQRAGIKPKDLSDSTFAPIIKALVLEAEQRKVQNQQQSEIYEDRHTDNNKSMPQSSIVDKIASQDQKKTNLLNDPKQHHAEQNDINAQILKGVQLKKVIPQSASDQELSTNERQGLTNLLAHAIEERRRQLQKNDYDSEEKSAWEDGP